LKTLNVQDHTGHAAQRRAVAHATCGCAHKCQTYWRPQTRLSALACLQILTQQRSASRTQLGAVAFGLDVRQRHRRRSPHQCQTALLLMPTKATQKGQAEMSADRGHVNASKERNNGAINEALLLPAAPPPFVRQNQLPLVVRPCKWPACQHVANAAFQRPGLRPDRDCRQDGFDS